MNYRSDIDGLRAVAVLSVVAYHFGLPGASGGYLGVDVFFVISGYLICGMIAKDLERGNFSLTQFYKRRVMRIFPVLFAMFIVTSALAYAYFLPPELKQYSSSLLWAVFSASNIYFAKTTGYFDPSAETKPLLHTWSLGVEEQFYLLCPLFLIFAFRRFRNHVGLVLFLGAALSFAGEILAGLRNPEFAFFLSPFRVWELIAGALLSMGYLPRLATQVARNRAGLVGAGLLAPLIVFAAPHLSHPLAALIACVGAVLIIASSESELSSIGVLLSKPPMVFVGLISYSLYLWHWPLAVFQTTDNFLLRDGAGLSGKLALFALSFALAILSWKFIETPFRIRTREIETPRVFAGAGAAMAGLALAAGLVMAGQGAPWRFPGDVVRLAAYLDYSSGEPWREGSCFLMGNRQKLDVETCLRKSATKPNWLLLGDSHAAHLWPGLSKALPNVNLMQATAAICRPVLAGDVSMFDTRLCPKLQRYLFEDYFAHERPDRALLAASWKDEDLPRLAETLAYLKARGIDVVVMGPIVEYDRPLPRLLADVVRYGDPERPKANRSAEIPALDARMRGLAARYGAAYVSVYDAVCPAGVCETFAHSGEPLQFDAGHLTVDGSLKVAKSLANSPVLQ